MATMNDIANAAGVSRPVVSCVFSPSKRQTIRVSDATRQRVLEAARELGYRPNQIARSIATGKTRVVAFVGSVMRYQFATATLGGVMAAAEERGYVVKILQSSTRLSVRTIADSVLSRRVDGLIAFHMERHLWGGLIHELGGQVPTVALDCAVDSGACAAVRTDNLSGCRLMIEHLTGLGHRRIGFIAGDTGAANNRRREFLMAAEEAGLASAEDLVRWGNWTLAGAEEATRDLLGLPADRRPTAIFCASDQMAMATLRTARSMGMSVPHDLSVAGFGDLEVAEMADPPLTSVQQPYEMMGRRAFDLLLARMDGRSEPKTPDKTESPSSPPDSSPPERVDIATTLAVRDSTGPARND